MITIPTGDLVGVIGDVLPFAAGEVRMLWDGAQLHTEAMSGPHYGRSTWDPDDEHIEEHQEGLGQQWGGADEPWSVVIGADDAKHIAAIYKLTGKGTYYVPLTVELLHTGLRVQRFKDTGHSAITTVAKDLGIAWPNVAEKLGDPDARSKPLARILFNAKLLADFGKVRQRGEMRMRFTGPAGAVHVQIGTRFTGAIQPVQEPTRIAAVPAAAPVENGVDGDQLPY